MVTEQKIKELEMDSVYHYYHELGRLYLRGKVRDIKYMIADLSKSQRRACYDYIENTWGNNADLRTTLQKLLID